MAFGTPSRTPNGATSYVISGTACVIGSTTTAIKTPNGVAYRTTTGCAITTLRGRELVTKTSRAITSATSQAITSAGGWSKRRAVDVKESVKIVWRRAARKVMRKSKISLPKPPPMPIPKAKQLLVTLSNKAINFRQKKKEVEGKNDEDFGDGGLWQRSILMGDKCQPLDFSGVIYYDSDGKRMSEPPMKSPRRFPSSVHDSSSNSGEI
nr:hypothetical protein DM860_010060 [Ipomoea trifida]